MFPDNLGPDLDGIQKEMEMLLNNQLDFSSHGPNSLWIANAMIIIIMKDATHFTTIVPEEGKNMAAFIRKAMDSTSCFLCFFVYCVLSFVNHFHVCNTTCNNDG